VVTLAGDHSLTLGHTNVRIDKIWSRQLSSCEAHRLRLRTPFFDEIWLAQTPLPLDRRYHKLLPGRRLERFEFSATRLYSAATSPQISVAFVCPFRANAEAGDLES
jgi:hypothetical protein